MKFVTLLLLLLLLIFTSATAAAVGSQSSQYKGDKVFKVNVFNRQQKEQLRVWHVVGLNGDVLKQLDFWQLPVESKEEATIRVPRQLVKEAEAAMQNAGMRWRIVNEDVSRLIDKELEQNRRASGDHSKFLTMSEIDAFVDRIVSGCGFCSVEEIGRSVEGRRIRVVKVGNHPSKPTIFVEGGAHAREWISPAALLYMLDKIVTDSSHSAVLNSWNLVFAIVINPDGYEYTHTSSRLWRKNRRQMGICYGVDLNRNFGHKWGSSGSSSWECSDLYRGSSAFSEPETASVRDFVLKNAAGIKAYWSVHSYGQLWLHPWGYARGINPDNVGELKSAADTGAAALRAVRGTSYRVGHSADILYAAAGGSDDWALSSGIRYAYTLELPDTGYYGFVLPPSMIRPVGEETLAALEAFLSKIK